jgi:hypothetical protein
VRAREYGLLSLRHLRDPLVPAANHLTLTHSELQRLSPLHAGVKHLPVLQLACIVSEHHCTWWTLRSLTFLEGLLVEARLHFYVGFNILINTNREEVYSPKFQRRGAVNKITKHHQKRPRKLLL